MYSPQWWIKDFPLGGADPLGGGGADLRCVQFLAKMYAKMKEMDPVGGGGRAPAAPPGPANAIYNLNGTKHMQRIHFVYNRQLQNIPEHLGQ